jgi:hypothetical protein
VASVVRQAGQRASERLGLKNQTPAAAVSQKHGKQ